MESARKASRPAARTDPAVGAASWWVMSGGVSMPSRAYRLYPDLRRILEPVLIASYHYAKQGKHGRISERANAVRELIRDRDTNDTDNADLTELKRLLEVRREMKKDGLL